MKKRKKKYLDNLYTYDKSNNTYEINLSLKGYEEVFNPFDYSQFKKRDLDSDFLDYIYDCALDIPLSYGIKLIFYLNKEIEDEAKNNNLKNAIKNNIYWKQRDNYKTLARGYRKVLTFFIIGIIFSVIGAMVDRFSGLGLFSNILYDGMVVACWVFWWKAIEMLAFDLVGLIRENRYLKRLLNCKMEFKKY